MVLVQQQLEYLFLKKCSNLKILSIFVAKSINYTIKGIYPKCKDINHMN